MATITSRNKLEPRDEQMRIPRKAPRSQPSPINVAPGDNRHFLPLPASTDSSGNFRKAPRDPVIVDFESQDTWLRRAPPFQRQCVRIPSPAASSIYSVGQSEMSYGVLDYYFKNNQSSPCPEVSFTGPRISTPVINAAMERFDFELPPVSLYPLRTSAEQAAKEQMSQQAVVGAERPHEDLLDSSPPNILAEPRIRGQEKYSLFPRVKTTTPPRKTPPDQVVSQMQQTETPRETFTNVKLRQAPNLSYGSRKGSVSSSAQSRKDSFTSFSSTQRAPMRVLPSNTTPTPKTRSTASNSTSTASPLQQSRWSDDTTVTSPTVFTTPGPRTSFGSLLNESRRQYPACFFEDDEDDLDSEAAPLRKKLRWRRSSSSKHQSSRIGAGRSVHRSFASLPVVHPRMGDSYRPDRHYPEDGRSLRGRDSYDDDRPRGPPRGRSLRNLDYGYDNPSDANEYYNRAREGVTNFHDRFAPPPETGENDVGQDERPLKLVLVRGLDPKITEEIFAKGMEKFYEDFEAVPGGAEPASLRRVLLVRDRRTERTLGYGFAEYHTVKDARAVVNKSRELKNVGKCTIRSVEITLCFPHVGVFPHADFGYNERNEKYTFNMPGSDRLHKYRLHKCYASEHFVNPDPSTQPAPSTETDAAEVKKPTKTGSKRGLETLESKSKKLKGPGPVAPAFLNHWQKKQAELRAETENSFAETPTPPTSGSNAIITTLPASGTTKDEQTFAYEGDVTGKEGEATHVVGCYLCGSEFDTRDGLLKHLNQSKLHASNLKIEAAIQKGYDRMKKKGIEPNKTIKLPQEPSAEQAAQISIDQQDPMNNYRDRAAERRLEETKKIGFSLKGTKLNSSGNVSGSSSDNESSKPKYGKGMNMLQKAGWSEGEGLGTGGGITAPIDQNLYASGVGLGHESSKKGDAVEEASRMTRNDRGEFLEKTKELAKKRFEQME